MRLFFLRHLLQLNRQLFIAILVAIKHEILFSFARYRYSRAIVIMIFITNELWSFVHYCATKLLCSCNLIAVKTTRSRTSSRPNHANMIIIAIGQRLSLQSRLATEVQIVSQRSALWLFVHSRAPNMQLLECNLRVSQVLGWLVALKGEWRETAFSGLL